MIYAGFWRRFGAYFLDLLCLMPLAIPNLWFQGQTRYAQAILLIPWVLFGLWYYVYLVKRYGGTPGKLILNMRITKTNGELVTYREAVLRYAPECILGILISVAYAIAALHLPDAEYLPLGWKEREQLLRRNVPDWYNPVLIADNIWIWSEFVVMLTNNKRRALHDFLAGTVVILKSDAQQVAPADRPVAASQRPAGG